jgi:proteasome lid subunit RPN8/RPN11
MGIALATDNQFSVSGGVDFSRLQTRKLGQLNGPRTESFQTIIRQSAMNRVRVHGDSSPRAEVCGVLVGDLYRDETGAFLLIEHIIEGASSNSSAGQVTFTADTWQHIQLLMDKQYPDLRIVGWYHTHPGHGVFLSDMDIFLHESFFGLPWQTALVYDPRSGEEGLFGAQQGQAYRMEFTTEVDEPAVGGASHAPPATNPAAFEDSTVRPAPLNAVYRPKGRFWASLGRFFLALIGLVLFTVMGGLLGLLIRSQHFEIPDWIQRMVHG